MRAKKLISHLTVSRITSTRNVIIVIKRDGVIIMTKFNFDQVHSDIQFKIKHLMVSQVKGTFKQFDVQLDGDINDLTSLKATATINWHSKWGQRQPFKIKRFLWYRRQR